MAFLILLATYKKSLTYVFFDSRSIVFLYKLT